MVLSQVLNSVELTLLLSVAALHIVHCPFNKVEESFNTQAIHDIINIFPNRMPYRDFQLKDNLTEIATRSKLPWDHVVFSGPVPRTFVGALLVGLPMKLFKHFLITGFMRSEDNEDEPDLTAQFLLQIGSRFALASFLVLSLSSVTKAIQRRYGLGYRLCFLLTTISQFHYMFYAGRFIPNTYAAVFANLVLASWINRQYSKSIMYSAFCAVIFRSDTALFFGWLILDAVFIKNHISLKRVLQIGIPAGLVAIFATFCVDSIFWSRPVWPELESLHFNLWLNKSHEWGTEPYFWYIYSCIPRMLMMSYPMILFADHKITRDYMIPTLAFILTYSILPHKELRFILFTTPFLNVSVASGLMNIHYYLREFLQCIKIRRNIFTSILFGLILLAIFIANLFGCFVLSRISSHNYPGGQAAISLGITKELLDKANKPTSDILQLQDHRSNVGVYVDNLAAQTGFSRFVQVDGVYYSKTPKIDDQSFRKSYELIYLVLEPNEVTDFLRSYCPLDSNQEQFVELHGADKWKRSDSEIRCRPPNQKLMYCSILDSFRSFKSINIGGLIRRLKAISSTNLVESFEDSVFIKTRIALHTIRCSTRSKFNPFD